MTMPTILNQFITQLEAKGMKKDEAATLATTQLEKYGILKKNGVELTAKGIKRQALGMKGRAIDRAVKQSHHPASDYKYSRKTNRATLK